MLTSTSAGTSTASITWMTPLDASTSVDLSVSWFRSNLALMATITLPILVGLFVAQVIGAVVRQCDHIATRLARHRRQGGIAPCSGPRFNALTARRFALQPLHRKAQRQPFARPALAGSLDQRRPIIGLRQQSVMHMQRPHFDALRLCRTRQAMQQRHRIAAAAHGHREREFHFSFVSEKRPYDCRRS